MFLKLFSIGINISIYDELINSYIYDRYRSFILKKPNMECINNYSIEEIELKDMDQWRNIFDSTVEDMHDCKIIDTSQVYMNIMYNSYLIYCKSEKKVYFCINNILKKYKFFIAVQLCNVVNYILCTEGISILHASAVTINNDFSHGACFVGNSGAGKTSIALKMAEKGEKMITDDLLYLDTNTMTGIKNFQFVGLHDYNLNHNFSYLSDAVVYSDIFEQNKKRLNLQKYMPEYFADKIIIKDVFIVDLQKRERSSIHQIDKNTVFKYLLKNTMFLQGISHDPLVNIIARILSSTNCYVLYPHNDVNNTTECIKNFYIRGSDNVNS